MDPTVGYLFIQGSCLPIMRYSLFVRLASKT